MPVKIHGKDYYTVAERIQMLNDTYKDKYSINTELLKCSDSVVIMKATLTFHLGADDVRTFVGHAMEEIGSSKINELSALEVCETSAIGRSISAAGMAGSGSEYCSADELANVLVQQESKTDAIHKREMDLDEAHHMLADEVADKLGGKVVTESNMIKFGKHKGKSWSDVSDDYVQWCMTKSSADFVKEQAQAEYNRRNKKDSKPVDLDEEIPF